MRLPWCLILSAAFSFGIVCAPPARAQFEIEDSHTTASLRGIANVGGGIAWASGTSGTVLRTLDDGKTWQTCPVPLAGTKDTAEKLDFRGIQAFDEKTAIVMSSGPGDQSRLYKTTDGCQTWKLLFTNPDKDGFWDVIRVPEHEQGILIGDPVKGSFAIYTTINRGESWEAWSPDYVHTSEKNRPAKARQGESLFAASNSSLVSPGINSQYAFVTGGKGGSRLLFEQIHSPFDASTRFAFLSVAIPIASSDTSGAFSIGRRDENEDPQGRFAGNRGRFVIVGGDYSHPEIGSAATASVPTFLIKVDIRVAKTPPHGYRSSVAYDASTKTWITVGPNGTDISTDDGRNWRPLTPTPQDAPDADKNWNALSLPFVVGPKGRIGKLQATTLHSPPPPVTKTAAPQP